jgi:DNA polymerase III subunit epsilon
MRLSALISLLMNSIDKLVFVDLETTGGRVNYDRIIEVAIIRVEHDQIVDTYQTLINPEMYLSPFIENMTGIQSEDLSEAPTFEMVKDEIVERLGDCTFVAHNVRFDYGFLRNELKRHDITYTAKHFCSAKLSRILYPKERHHNLDAIIERFKFTCNNRHRAYDDAKVLWDFYQHLNSTLERETFTEALQKALYKPSVPTGLSEQDLEELPEEPGVYIFYGTENTPLYIGKSVNIKQRVLSHFSSDHLSSREMSICNQTTRIETFTTPGELGALFMESSLIKSMQPLYNRQLRLVERPIIARMETNSDGYHTVRLESVNEISVEGIDTVLGVFKSKRQAKTILKEISAHHSLCEKLVGLEKAVGSCFAHKLERCRGACVRAEKPMMYNLRFIEAFTKHRIKSWPYEGPIVIQERAKTSDQAAGYIIDKWCLLGSINGEKSSVARLESNTPEFNMDTYHIIHRYLNDKKRTPSIQRVSYDQIAQYAQEN